MWIRSQDREILLSAKKIFTYHNAVMISIGGDDMSRDMGVYKSKERAIEVLEEIQSVIFNGVQTIYEMPKE